VQLAYSARAELRAVERHLPTLSAAHPRLFANICYCRPKIVHLAAAVASAGTLSLSPGRCRSAWFAYRSSFCSVGITAICAPFLYSKHVALNPWGDAKL
jgi:hypothetical protein